MPNNTNAPATVDPRLAEIQGKVDAILADPAKAKVAEAVRKCGQGDFGPLLAKLILAGTNRQVITQGYAAARAIEFAKRPKYLSKNASHVWSDVTRHAANHFKQAQASLFAASQKVG